MLTRLPCGVTTGSGLKASSMAEQSGPAGRLPSGISDRERERERGHNWWQLQDHYATTVHPEPFAWRTMAGETFFARIDAAAAREEACPGMCSD